MSWQRAAAELVALALLWGLLASVAVVVNPAVLMVVIPCTVFSSAGLAYRHQRKAFK